MIERALTREETHALIALITQRGQRAQIRAQSKDGTIYWIVVDPTERTWKQQKAPIAGIPTYPAEATN